MKGDQIQASGPRSSRFAPSAGTDPKCALFDGH